MFKKQQHLRLIQESICFICFNSNFYFLIILTDAFGWLIFKLDCFNWFLLKKNVSILTCNKSPKFVIKNFNYINFSLFKTYSQYIKVIGRGYKFTYIKKKLVLRIGFSHKIIFKIPKNVILGILNRYNFFLSGRNFFKIKNLIFNFLLLKGKSLYKRKGIFSKGTYFKLKKNNKKKLY